MAIIGSIGSELAALIYDLMQQMFQLRGVACFLICQTMGNDLATVGIDRQVQFSPATAGLCPMLFFQPLPRALNLEAGTVDRVGGRSPQAGGRFLWPMAFRFWLAGSA